MDTAPDAAIGAHTAPLVRFGQVNAKSVLNDSVSTPMTQQMGLSNGYAQNALAFDLLDPADAQRVDPGARLDCGVQRFRLRVFVLDVDAGHRVEGLSF